jgi:hypothetical protein
MMLKVFLMVASFANCAGGFVLIAAWSAMPQRVPIIVLFIGGSLLIQGLYTILYVHREFARWGDIATGALLAGEALSACVGAAGLIQGMIHNAATADMEITPVLAGLLMLVQALLALTYLVVTDLLRPELNGRRAA